MKTLKRNALKVMKAATKAEVKRSTEIWPPLCAGLLHQPKRPKHNP